MIEEKKATRHWQRLTVLPMLICTAFSPPAYAAADLFSAIAWCESRGLQYNKDGSVHRSPNNQWVGKFQINEASNGKDARARGFDIYTEAGNTAYAHDLYARRGTAPWIGSQRCWSRLVSSK